MTYLDPAQRRRKFRTRTTNGLWLDLHNLLRLIGGAASPTQQVRTPFPMGKIEDRAARARSVAEEIQERLDAQEARRLSEDPGAESGPVRPGDCTEQTETSDENENRYELSTEEEPTCDECSHKKSAHYFKSCCYLGCSCKGFE